MKPEEKVNSRCPVCGYSNFITDGEVVLCVNCHWCSNDEVFDGLPDWDTEASIGTNDFDNKEGE